MQTGYTVKWEGGVNAEKGTVSCGKNGTSRKTAAQKNRLGVSIHSRRGGHTKHCKSNWSTLQVKGKGPCIGLWS